ncbi:MAG: DsrE/DsrF/DrsH-like family protein [Chloroflexota bacterium]
MEQENRLSMVVFSGDMDKVLAAFVIATGAAASGMEVSMFFTFWGLKAVQKGNLTGKGFFGKMLGLMNRGGIDRIGPSRFNFHGAGRWLFKKMMRDHKVATPAELRKLTIELGVKLIACQMSMEVMEVRRGDLIDEVADCVGVATFLEGASRSKITLFI